MDDRPRNLKAMLSEAKDTSELMVDLAYAALYFGDPDMAEEVSELEEHFSALVHDMRAVCVLAARRPQEADEMASVLQVISAIENIANDAVDIARIVTHRLGIPRELVADLSNAEAVSNRVRVRDSAYLARPPLSSVALAVTSVTRVVSTRRHCACCSTSRRPPRTSATKPSRWCGSSSRRRSSTRSSRSRSASPTRSWCGCPWRRARGPTGRRSASCASTSSPASTCSRC